MEGTFLSSAGAVSVRLLLMMQAFCEDVVAWRAVEHLGLARGNNGEAGECFVAHGDKGTSLLLALERGGAADKWRDAWEG